MTRKAFKCELDGVSLEEIWVKLESNQNNQLRIVIYDLPGEWKYFGENMKGSGLLKVFVNGPTRCPHCDEILEGFLGGDYELEEIQHHHFENLEVIKVDQVDEHWEVLFKYGNCISKLLRDQ